MHAKEVQHYGTPLTAKDYSETILEYSARQVLAGQGGTVL